MNPNEAQKEALTAEAIQAAAVLAEAKEKAHEAQIKQAVEEGVKAAFSEKVEKGRYVDVSRIPLICQNISQIHSDIGEINNNMKSGAQKISELELHKAKQEGFSKAMAIFGAAAWTVCFAFTSWVAFQVIDTGQQIQAINAKLSAYDIQIK